MRAIRVHEFGGPEVLRLEEIERPSPGAGQVLVRVRAAGVNPVDTYIRSGAYARKPRLPYTPGGDGSGEVAAVGEGVSRFAPGDRVFFGGTIDGPFGAYAEMAVCNEHQVHRLPDRLDFAQGAAIHTAYATAYKALFFHGRAIPGETVLVHGASGSVGTAALQLARSHGLEVIGTAGTERGLELVRNQGATYVANHRAEGYREQIRSWTGGRGVDLIIEMLANVNLADDLKLLAPRGRVIVVGNRGRTEIDARDAMARDASIIGMLLFNASDAEMKAIQAAIDAGLESGSLTPVVGRELPLEQAAAAHEAVMAPGAYGKIVLMT